MDETMVVNRNPMTAPIFREWNTHVHYIQTISKT